MIPQSLGEWLVTANLFGSLAIGLVVAAIPLVRRFCGSRAAFLLWTIVLIRLLAPVFPTAPFVSVRHADAPLYRTAAWGVSEERSVLREAGAANVPAAPAKKAAGNPWLLAWLFGAGVAMALPVVGIFRGWQIRRRGANVTESVRAAVPELPRRLRVLASGEVPGPALCGLFAPAILLPAGCLENFSAEHLRCVVQHEIGHFRRGDLWWRWAFLIARSLHWFNPLVWWAERRARIDQELACDEWVLARERVDRRVYGEALLVVTRMLGVARTRPLQISMAESSRGLERRLGHVARGRRRGRFARGLALAVVAIAALALGPVRVAADSAKFAPESASEPAASGDFVEVRSKFVELPSAVADEVFGAEGARGTSILKRDRFEDLIRRLDNRKGVDLMSAPTVTAKSGQRAVVNIIREFRYPTEYDADPQVASGVTPSHFETRNVGVTLEVEAAVGPQNRIDLTLSPEVVEFMGFVNYGTDHPARSGGTDALAAALAPQPDAQHAINQPVFDVRKTTTSVTVKSGETVVLGGLRGNGNSFENVILAQPANPKGTDRLLFVFVTARAVGRAEMEEMRRQAAKSAPAPPAPSKNLPYGTPVEGKPGFVTSPYAPAAGYVDLRGFPKDTEVKDPYSGKIFLVPEMGQPVVAAAAARRAAEESHFDFVVEDAPVKEVLNFIGARSHLTIDSGGVKDDGRKFTFKVRGISAADALGYIAGSAGLRIDYADDAVRVTSKGAE